MVRGALSRDLLHGRTDRKAEITAARPCAFGAADRLENGKEDIVLDPASQSMAEGWRTGAVKALERQFAAFVPKSAANLG